MYPQFLRRLKERKQRRYPARAAPQLEEIELWTSEEEEEVREWRKVKREKKERRKRKVSEMQVDREEEENERSAKKPVKKKDSLFIPKKPKARLEEEARMEEEARLASEEREEVKRREREETVRREEEDDSVSSASLYGSSHDSHLTLYPLLSHSSTSRIRTSSSFPRSPASIPDSNRSSSAYSSTRIVTQRELDDFSRISPGSKRIEKNETT